MRYSRVAKSTRPCRHTIISSSTTGGRRLRDCNTAGPSSNRKATAVSSGPPAHRAHLWLRRLVTAAVHSGADPRGDVLRDAPARPCGVGRRGLSGSIGRRRARASTCTSKMRRRRSRRPPPRRPEVSARARRRSRAARRPHTTGSQQRRLPRIELRAQYSAMYSPPLLRSPRLGKHLGNRGRDRAW